MILGIREHHAAHCFDEINDAVESLTKKRIVFNALFPGIPKKSIIYNFENYPPADPKIYKDHEVWEFSKRSADKYKFIHVPVGYHPTMERFKTKSYRKKEFDVVFCGIVNERRKQVLDEITKCGLKVHVISNGLYGKERDSILARSKLALNMLYYPHGSFPVLRVAHCVANKVAVLSEDCAESEGWHDSGVAFFPYNRLAEVANFLIKRGDMDLQYSAERAYNWFKERPLILPR